MSMVRTTITGRWQDMPWLVFHALRMLTAFDLVEKHFPDKALWCKTKGLIAHDRTLRDE